MADVVKGKWYPAPPPALPDESDVDYTNRLLGKENPYDHQRNRQCSIGYHRECSDRYAGSGTGYSGDCGCPCHTDDSTMAGDESICEVVEILCGVYSLPTRSGWHVVHVVDLLTGRSDMTIERVRHLLGVEYGSPISEGFAVDVAHMMANKGPKGAARAFWKRVHGDWVKGQKLLSMVKTPEPVPQAPMPTLSEVLRRAIEQVENAPMRAPEPPVKPITLADLGAYPEDHPRYGEHLAGMVMRALDEADVILPPGSGKIELRLKEWAGGLFERNPETIEMVHEGRSVYSFEVPVRDFLGLPDAVAQTPPPALWQLRGGKATPVYPKPLTSLLGMPVKADASLPPGTWKLRAAEETEHIGTWPRIKVPGIEPLSEALARHEAGARDQVRDWGWPAPDSERHPLEFHQWLIKQKWFTTGIALVDQMRAQCAPSMLKGLSWRVPMRLFPRVTPGQTAMLFGVPLRIDESLPVDGTPYLAFDLEES